MKWFVFVVVALLACATARAEWLEFSPTTFVLAPSDGINVDLAVAMDPDTHQPTISVMRIGLDRCQPEQETDLGAVGIYTVNGKMIRFNGHCDDGKEFDRPASVQGQSFLNSVVQHGANVTLKYDVFEVHFQTSGYAEAEKQLIAAQSAL